MKFKKIEIDKNSYIKYFENGIFEIHTSASGPLGAEVYFFERGLFNSSRANPLGHIFFFEKYL